MSAVAIATAKALRTKLIRTATWAFWVLGVGSMLATAAGLLLFFRRKAWV